MSDPREMLDRMSAGYQDAIILLTANRLGVFAALAGGPRELADLAGDLALDRRALDLLLRALVGAGVLRLAGPDAFALPEELVPFLSPAGESSLSSILDHHHNLLARWSVLADVVRSGRPAPREDRDDPDARRAFICGMKDISRRSSEEVADALPDLGGRRRLLDLGGGPGTSALAFCRRWPRLTAVVFDLPEVVPIAREEIAAAGLSDRVTTLAGDYLRDPLLADGEEPYDAIYVSNIIHSCSDQETARLLAAAVAVLAPGGQLVVKDFFLADDRTGPAFGARFAVNMLVGTEGGKSYTWSETERLLRDLGLQELRRLEVAGNSGLIVARRTGP